MEQDKVNKVARLLEDRTAYLSDGHVFCYANVSPQPLHEYPVPAHLRQNESDILLFKPFTVLGLRPEKCTQSPWGPGCLTCNVWT